MVVIQRGSFMDVLIPIETTSREILYKVYLCHKLVLKGFNCYLGNKRNILFLLKNNKNYIYLDKGYHKGVSDQLYKIIQQQEGYIINLDEEGAVDYPDSSTLKHRYAKALFEVSEFTFLWGIKQYKLIENMIPGLGKTMVTGHPRFELLKPTYRYLYADEVNALKRNYGDFILINTNIGFGNNIKGDDFVRENYGKRFGNIQDIIEFDKHKRDAFVELVKAIIHQTNKSIVFRPHPEEDSQWYQQAFSGINRVIINSKGSVVHWLLAAEVMIHPDCTTAIESLLLGKKSISYLPPNSAMALITRLPVEASYPFTNLQHLIDHLNTGQFIVEDPNLQEHPFLEDYFSYSKDSTRLIIDQITKFKKQIKQKPNNLPSLTDQLFLRYLSFKAHLARGKSAELARSKLNGFTKKNILNIHNLFLLKEPALEDVKIQCLANGLFFFAKSYSGF
jgi:surface carbohydrate biosynthesis protein